LPPALAITGALNWDINLFVKRLPLSGQEVVVEKIDRVPGGKGGNVSVAASRILGPGHVALLACVGRDDVGKKQIAILKLWKELTPLRCNHSIGLNPAKPT